MQRRLDGFPDWRVEIVEGSVGVYNLLATHQLGPSIELKGTDPDELLARARTAARDIEKEIATRRPDGGHK